MPWTDPAAAIGIDKPIRASTHLAIFENFAAMAAGEPGAPRVQVPEALGTSETNDQLVLSPDGAGGVLWRTVPGTSHVAANNGGSGNTSAPVPATGTWLILAAGVSARDDDTDDSNLAVGHAILLNGTLVFQHTYGKRDNGVSHTTNRFTYAGGMLTWADPTFEVARPASFIAVQLQ